MFWRFTPCGSKAEAERVAAEQARQAALIRQEEARVRALQRAATNLERAEQIRRLIAAATHAAQANGQAVDAGTPFGDWLVWAARQADRIDPLTVSPPSIVDSKPEPQPRYVPYGYREPDPTFRWPQPSWKTCAK